MNRNAKLLSALKDKDSELILELGPLHEPIAKQPEHNVRYVDRMTHKELVEHYTPQGIPVDKIVPLDHVWPPGENLSDHIPGNRFAYCIASHVIEHVPDMVGWLNQLESVMETGSTLSLAIPNQPATFDRKRPCTTTAEVVEAAILESTRPTPKQVYCHFRNNVDSEDTYSETPEFALHAARQSAAGVYVDVHCWVFNEESFGRIIKELQHQKLTRFALIESSTEGGEFFAKLRLA